MARGVKAQARRRVRRAANRMRAQQTPTNVISEDEAAQFAALLERLDAPEDFAVLLDALTAGAQGGSFPLGARDEEWDGAAAEKSYTLPGDASCYMWKDPDGDASAKSSYKLAFVSKDGSKHAVWGAITAIAAILQGGRGGVDIPAADKAAVKTKVEGYYAKARTKYGDDQIKVPWDKSENSADADIEETPEALALAALDAFQNGVRCNCGHPFSEHIGGDGPCKHEDGRGTCSCGSFAEMAAEQPVGTPEPTLALEGEVVFAVGDVALGPEDGFLDLLCDLNEALGSADNGPYSEQVMAWDAPRAVDVAVSLDKALICVGDDYFVAPISIGSDGEPTIAPQAEWTPVEGGWVEVAPEDDEDEAMGGMSAARLRGILREFVTDTETIPAPAERLPDPNPSPAAPEVKTSSMDRTAWNATFVPEGRLTEDGRAFAPGALSWRELPLSLMAMVETQDGHDGATLSGRIDQIWRDGTLIKAAGIFDSGEFGSEIARLVGDGTLRGLSVDIAPLEWFPAPAAAYFDTDGNWIGVQDENGDWQPAPGYVPDGSDAFAAPVTVITKAVIGMATVCPFPAFADANISLVASAGGNVWRYTSNPGWMTGVVPDQDALDSLRASLTASAAGLATEAPPLEWFQNPEFGQLTPMTVDDDGRIYGHAWAWGSCHMSFDQCVTAPHSETDYAYFHLGEITTAEGDRVAVGKITLDTRHAGPRLSRVDATAHYDNTGTVSAYVVMGEDEHGGWFTGAIAEDLPEAKLKLLRGSTVSGDWRSVNGNLELVALLAVNVPGFPVPRALIAAGDVKSLVAAGVVVEETDDDVVADIAALAASVEE